VLASLQSIKTKVTLIVTIGVVTLLVLVSALQEYRVKSDFRAVLGNQQMTLVARVADDIDEKLASAHTLLIGASKTIRLEIAGNPTKLRAHLETRPGLQLTFDNLLIFSSTGTTLVDFRNTGLAGASVSDREFFTKVISDRKPYISQPFLGRNTKQPFVVLTAPILNGRGEVVGILGGSWNLLRPNFLGKLGAAKVGKTGSFALFGRDRTIIMSRDADRIMQPGPPPGASPYFDHAVAGEEGWLEAANSRGLHALFSYSPLERVPWVLVAALPVDEAFAPIAETQRDIARMTLLLIVLIAPLVWLGTWYLLAPLLALHDAIRRARGDPGASTEVPVRRRDEIGDLAADFNELIRERTRAESSLRESERRLRMIMDKTPALIGYIDSDLKYRYANGTYFEWFGKKPEELLGKSMREVLGDAAYAVREPHVREALAGREATFDVPRATSGFNRHAHTRYVPDVRADGSVAGFYVLASDVTALAESRAELERAAWYDTLTGLPNRNLLSDRLEQVIARSRRTGQRLALFYLDLDGFKAINDTLGHAAGDALLKQFAERLKQAVRATDTVARLSGDEFVILLEDLKGREDADTIASTIIAATREEFMIESKPLRVTTCIGIAFASGDIDSAELLKRADAALYEAKRAGRDRYHVAQVDEPQEGPRGAARARP
jgi:diguanylate cyclase (GGDEF)-like protein/PAS domain S-box-containing protein